MQQDQLKTEIDELRTQRNEQLAQPPGTPEENFSLDLKMIDIDLEANELEDQLERDLALTFHG